MDKQTRDRALLRLDEADRKLFDCSCVSLPAKYERRLDTIRRKITDLTVDLRTIA